MTAKTAARPAADDAPVLEALDGAIDEAAAVAEAAQDDLHRAQLAALDAAAAELAEAEGRAQAARVALTSRQADLAGAIDREEALRLEAERVAALERLAGLRTGVHETRGDLTTRLDELIAQTVAVAHGWGRWETDRANLRDMAGEAHALGLRLGEPGAGHGLERDSLSYSLARRDTVATRLVAQALPGLVAIAMNTPPPAEVTR